MSHEEKPLLSIIIVNYNVKDLLFQSLNSIRSFVSDTNEVIVIDNASSDDSCQEIRKNYPEVNLIENKKNIGFSAANNQGFAIAKGKYFLMLNPDAYFLDSSYKNAITFLQNEPGQHLIIGPRIYNPDNSYQDSAWKFPRLTQHLMEAFFLNKLIDTSSYVSARGETGSFSVDFLSGAALLMRSETQKSIGNLDEKLFWMEDVDFCYRNKLLGGKNWYFPQWKTVHYVGASSKKNLSVVISNQLISKLKFYKKHKRKLTFVLSAIIFFIHSILRLIILFPVSLVSTKAFTRLKAYAFTFKKLWRYLLVNDESLT